MIAYIIIFIFLFLCFSMFFFLNEGSIEENIFTGVMLAGCLVIILLFPLFVFWGAVYFEGAYLKDLGSHNEACYTSNEVCYITQDRLVCIDYENNKEEVSMEEYFNYLCENDRVDDFVGHYYVFNAAEEKAINCKLAIKKYNDLLKSYKRHNENIWIRNLYNDDVVEMKYLKIINNYKEQNGKFN